jgi:protein CLEC16A
LYVEAIKFFNHPETMVRIAVRTLTLNIFKGISYSIEKLIDFLVVVSDSAMHRFILDRTATEYFSNLVWFIRTHIIGFDNLIRNNRE